LSQEYICINTLYKGDNDDDDDDDDDDNIFNRKWAVTRWQWLLCMYINMK